MNTINEAIGQFNEAARILKEDYGVMPDEEYQEQEFQGEEMPEEEGGDVNLANEDERIAQIREIALQGLQDYAQDVDSEQYQFYKKVWLMCDKAVSEKESAGDGQ